MNLLRLSISAIVLAGLAVAAADQPSAPSAQAPSNLDYWLSHATTAPASRPATRETEPFAAAGQEFSRPDALPGAVQMASGRLAPGRIYTTAGKDLEVWLDPQERWRHVPLVIIRGIHAMVVSEQLEQEWRWKQTGSDEKVYTGRQRPVRRLHWRVSLIDGTSLTGEIKGQPVWVERDGKRTLHVLGGRTKGDWGQSLGQLDYPAHIVFSRREMERVGKHLESAPWQPAEKVK